MIAAEKKIAVIIIAAGASSRLGRPKQLLHYANKPMLQHLLQVSSDSVAAKVIVVLGANAEKITSEVAFGEAQVVVNEGWQEGMASSIRTGIKVLVEIEPLIAGAIIMLCDQPYITSTLLDCLITTYLNTDKPIVASEYNSVLGSPAFFQRSIFPELLQLKGDAGAKVIIQQHSKEVEAVAFSKGDIDIDTPADYEQVSKKNS